MVKLLVRQEDALEELGKFFTLAGEGTKGLMMPNSYIDEEWHSMLEKPEEYKEFCLEHAGVELEHVPSGGVDEFVWVKDYEQKYGKLNIVWFIKSNGTFDNEAYEVYVKDGIVKMSWDCAPLQLPS